MTRLSDPSTKPFEVTDPQRRPALPDGWQSAVPASAPPREGAAEYDALLGRLVRHLGEQSAASLVGLVGCERSCGVSTLSANLAIRAADHQFGPVVLIDADAMFPTQHKWFRLSEGPGLANVLAGELTLEQAVQPTRIPGLFLLSAGKTATGLVVPAVRGGGDSLVHELREWAGLVIFDLPAPEHLTHVMPLLRALDTLLLVVASEHSKRDDALRLRQQLAADGVALSGAIVNRHSTRRPGFFSRRG